MRFVFIDEIQQTQRDPNFFGLGIFIVDAFHYQDLVDNFIDSYIDCGWNPEIEFKGKYLFSKSGDRAISVDKRILLVDSMVDRTTAKKNAKAQFFFVYNENGSNKANYFMLVSEAFKSLQAKDKSNGKHLVVLYYDYTDLFMSRELSMVIDEIMKKKGLQQVEMPCPLKSCNKTVGIIYCDVLSYLASWDVLNPRTDEAVELSLFDIRPNENDRRKLNKIREILSKVKSLKIKHVNS